MARYYAARNVAEAYPLILSELAAWGVERGSRAGDVVAFDEPVLLKTAVPTERVLLDPGRRANPFLHLMESLWMLAGRQDYTWLDQFVSDFSKRFGEADGHGHGAYGHRWRHHFAGRDQLEMVVEMLRKNPDNRRVVIQMWDPVVDLGVAAKDLPCNTSIYPRIVDGALQLTICCRSNDIIWGMLGSNIVHFSILQEYLAGRIGVSIGPLHQLANNCHAYTDQWAKVGVPEPVVQVYPDTIPIGDNWAMWDEDLTVFMDSPDQPHSYYNEWFHETAHRMYMAHRLCREHQFDQAISYADAVSASDWRLAARTWIKARIKG